MQEQIDQLKKQVADLNRELSQLKENYYKNNFTSTNVFYKDVEFKSNVSMEKMRINKIGLGVSPTGRQSAITAPSGGGASSTDAIDISARSAINSIRSVLSTLGFTN